MKLTKEEKKALRTFSILDLLGGRTYLKKTEPTETSPGMKWRMFVMKLTPSKMWPQVGHEGLKSRVKRVLRSFKNLPDLIGGFG